MQLFQFYNIKYLINIQALFSLWIRVGLVNLTPITLEKFPKVITQSSPGRNSCETSFEPFVVLDKYQLSQMNLRDGIVLQTKVDNQCYKSAISHCSHSQLN